MDDLIAEFVLEAREGIEALDSELVRFEQSPDNPKLLEEVFRLIHTIKGTSGFIGLVRLQDVAHSAETVLGGFRDGSTVVTPEAVSAILEAVDVIRALIEGLAKTGLETPGDDSALIGRLETAARIASGSVPQPQSSSATAQPMLARLGGEATLDSACEMTIGRIAGSAAFAPLQDIDPDRLQGALRDGLCAAARGFGDAAYFSGQIRGLTGSPPPIELLHALMAEIAGDLAVLEVDPAAIAQLNELVSPKTGPDHSGQVHSPPSPGPAALSVASNPQEPGASGPSTSESVASGAVASGPVALGPVAPGTADGLVAAAQTIRVSVDALEHMMTVVSELVLIRNQLLQLLRLEPESAFAAPLHRLNQVTSELQEGVMTTRMQPINGAWAKLPRLVRDLAQDLGKKIDLTLKGQDTELDRQVLELIKDPLTHMIRNAADHGLETPDERRAAGKSETGRIALSARHEGGAIVIDIADDGRGLSAAKIRAKAVSSGVVTAQHAETMSDAEARHLIFLPGFSTAREVTAVSGRGVGMDVVRTNIEKIGGVIELASTEGAGSQFTIQIPLTLTIVSALIVECCGERFAMPQSSVVELVSANNASGRSIEYINGAAVLRLRDRLLPLVSLQDLLSLPIENARASEACIVVARVGAFSFGVIVDRVFDTEEIVVKPVASVLRHLKLYSGATILGDGAVIMILDFKGMALESGCGKTDPAAEDDTTCAPSTVPLTAILLFRAPNGALKAAPLAAVSRIEEIQAAQIETVDGRCVIQYRGQLMPVIGSDGRRPDLADHTGPAPLLVFDRDGRAAGLLVQEIVDIVEASLVTSLRPGAEGSLGSLIIAERATELIDVDYFWDLAMGVRPSPATLASSRQSRLSPEAVSALKRLLLVDQSPFCQLLLRPLLAQAGYDVIVAKDPEAALALHDEGERFDLIMADTSASGSQAQHFARSFARANRWHSTPLLGLGLHAAGAGAFNETTLLEAVSDTLDDQSGQLRGAA